MNPIALKIFTLYLFSAATTRIRTLGEDRGRDMLVCAYTPPVIWQASSVTAPGQRFMVEDPAPPPIQSQSSALVWRLSLRVPSRSWRVEERGPQGSFASCLLWWGPEAREDVLAREARGWEGSQVCGRSQRVPWPWDGWDHNASVDLCIFLDHSSRAAGKSVYLGAAVGEGSGP